MRSQLLLKLERLLIETCQTLWLRIAAKFRLHHKGSLVKLNSINENYLGVM